jgi:hypothetical protein
MANEQRIRLISSLEIVTAVGFILFWVAFFTIGMAPEKPPAAYFAYEHSFPLPDTLLCILLIIAGILLMKGKAIGTKLSLIDAGGLMFLGLVDFAFNLLNGVYASSILDLVINAVINAWCVGFGLFVAIVLSKSA